MRERSAQIPVEEKVVFLKQPASYPHHVSNVEVKETHMSLVFLADDFVYKLKKPVKYHLLDLTTLESRFQNCKDEVRLNLRLAAGIYLGMVSLRISSGGDLQIDGTGRIIDWIVKMRRLPEKQMLDYTIRAHQLDSVDVKSAARLLAGFYMKSPPAELDKARYREKLRTEIVSYYPNLIEGNFGLHEETINEVKDALLSYFEGHAELFEKRVDAGKIVDGHGDLKPEHIYAGENPAIVDCLEFNKDLRILDAAEEISFLAMECEVLGDSSVGEIFFTVYKEETGDKIPEELIFFYKAKRAFLRTFLVARHLLESEYKGDPKWIARANTYLALAKRYSAKLI